MENEEGDDGIDLINAGATSTLEASARFSLEVKVPGADPAR